MKSLILVVLMVLVVCTVSVTESLADIFIQGGQQVIWDSMADFPNPRNQNITISGAGTKLTLTGEDDLTMTGLITVNTGATFEIADYYGADPGKSGLTLTGGIVSDDAGSEFHIGAHSEIHVTGNLIASYEGEITTGNGGLRAYVDGILMHHNGVMTTQSGTFYIANDVTLQENNWPNSSGFLNVTNTEFVFDGGGLIIESGSRLTANGGYFRGINNTAGDWEGIRVPSNFRSGSVLEMNGCTVTDAGKNWKDPAPVYESALYLNAVRGYFTNGIICNNLGIGLWIADENAIGYTTFTMENSKVYDCTTDGIYIWRLRARGHQTGDRVIVHNVESFDNGGSGIWVRHCWQYVANDNWGRDVWSSPLRISNSRFHDNTEAGVRYYGDYEETTHEGVEIANVASYENGWSGFEIHLCTTNALTPVVLYHCNSLNNGGDGFSVEGASAAVGDLQQWGIVNCISGGNAQYDVRTYDFWEGDPSANIFVATVSNPGTYLNDGNLTNPNGPDGNIDFENESAPFDFHLEVTNRQDINHAMRAGSLALLSQWADNEWTINNFGMNFGPNDFGVWGGPCAYNWKKVDNLTGQWVEDPVYRSWGDANLVDAPDWDAVDWKLKPQGMDQIWALAVNWNQPTYPRALLVPPRDRLQVTSTCVMVGTASAPLTVTSQDPNEPFDRIEITNTATASCQFKNLEIIGADCGLKFNGTTTTSQIPVEYCSFTDCGLGIYVNNSRVRLYHNVITGSSGGGTGYYGQGIYLVNCGSGKVLIDHCTVNNNGIDGTVNSAGIYLSSSSPEIIWTEVKDNSGGGIFCSASTPDLNTLSGSNDQPNSIESNGGASQGGLTSDGSEIYLVASSYPDINYNNISDGSPTPNGYLIYKNSTTSTTVNAKNNWWNGYAPSNSWFYWGTGGAISYSPYSTTKLSSAVEFDVAMEFWDEGEYADAADHFRNCVADSGSDGVNSVHYLAGCVGMLENGDYNELRGFLQDVAAEHPDSEVAKTALRFATDCLTQQGLYEDAMDEYDARRANAACLEDSILAVVDYLSVYELAHGGDLDAAMGDIPSKMSQLLAGLEGSQNGKGGALPTEIALMGCYPNPFNGITTINFAMPQTGNVKLGVYDMAGREVTRLAEGRWEAGTHRVSWQADGVPTGVYLVRLESAGAVQSMKAMLVK